MSSAENSFIGFAKQVSKGTMITADASFDYVLFNEGTGVSPNNVSLPLDDEVGGGALMRNVVKVGVFSGGRLSLIPRPATLGHFLLGALGTAVTDLLLPAHAIDGALVATGFVTHPETCPVKVVASGTATGNVVVTGTDSLDGAQTETLALNGTTPVIGTKSFKTVTSVQLPTVSQRTVTMNWVPVAAHSHVFTLGADQFDAPYYTMRSAPGGLWGENAKDCRFNGLSMNWRGANFVRADVGFVGGTPAPVSTATWAALSKVDGGPQFLSPLAKIEVPDGTALKVLQGAFTAGMAIPLDEQWIIGSYSPDAMDIVKRMFSLSMVVKLDSETLYKKIMYDPAGGSVWAADLFREANLDILFNSDQEIGAGTIPYSFAINGNGQTGSAANIVWSAQPVSLRAGKTITMALTGTFLADPSGLIDPIKVTLINGRTSY